MASQIVTKIPPTIPKKFKHISILFTIFNLKKPQTIFSNIPPNAYKLNKHHPKFSAPQLQTSFSSSSSSSSSSIMEVKKISEMEHDNKENIPPFSTSKKPGRNEEKGKCTSLSINRSRRPLRDVTDCYRASSESELREYKLSSTVLVCRFSSNRKRKLVDDGAEQRSCSKILRREYR